MFRVPLTVIEQVVELPNVVLDPRVPTVCPSVVTVVPEHVPQLPLGKKTSPPAQLVQLEATVVLFVQLAILLWAFGLLSATSVQPEVIAQSAPPLAGAGLLQY